MPARDPLAQALSEGTKKLGLNLGIISNVRSETYLVHLCKNNDMGIEPGSIFELSQTYCTDVINQNSTKHYQDVANITEMLKHPCYVNTQLRAYIGTPLIVNGKIWGTVNYSSLSPREVDYSREEIVFLESQAKAIGRILEEQLTT